MIKILDNIIPKEEQEQLKDYLHGSFFQWYYTKDITNPDDNVPHYRPGLFHNYFIDGVNNSEPNYHFIKSISDKVNKIIQKNLVLYNVRSFLHLPLNEKFMNSGDNKHKADTPHIDLDSPHTVFLYYVNDADGDTLLYDYKSTNILDRPKYENIKVTKRITPKQGRVVVFDGMTWHSSSQPTRGSRCVINFDMVSDLTIIKK